VVEILVPSSPEHFDQVRDLMRAFVAWHRERHRQDLRLIDDYFNASDFEHELQTLPGKYASPEGAVLLARVDAEPAGCVALRRIDARACEMKRMFLYPRFHGQGIGRALGKSIILAGKAAGYSVMRLDTSVRQTEARALYESLGFRRTEPYYELPAALRHWLVFMELPL
jgi:putative acetyltransferase